ncbi:hypothetical protein FFZ99_20010, partial [Leptospira interrogans]
LSFYLECPVNRFWDKLLYNTNFEGFALSNKLNEKQMPDWYFVLIPSPYIKDKVYNLSWFQKRDLELIDTK